MQFMEEDEGLRLSHFSFDLSRSVTKKPKLLEKEKIIRSIAIK